MPGVGLVQLKLKGAEVTVPISWLPAKNFTLVIVPNASCAPDVIARPLLASTTPFVAEVVTAKVGGTLIKILAGEEVVVNPLLSVATAVRVNGPVPGEVQV